MLDEISRQKRENLILWQRKEEALREAQLYLDEIAKRYGSSSIYDEAFDKVQEVIGLDVAFIAH